MLWSLSPCYCGLDKAIYDRVRPDYGIRIPTGVASESSWDHIIPKWCLNVSLLNPRPLNCSMLCVGPTRNLGIPSLCQDFINERKPGQNSLPTLIKEEEDHNGILNVLNKEAIWNTFDGNCVYIVYFFYLTLFSRNMTFQY